MPLPPWPRNWGQSSALVVVHARLRTKIAIADVDALRFSLDMDLINLFRREMKKHRDSNSRKVYKETVPDHAVEVVV